MPENQNNMPDPNNLPDPNRPTQTNDNPQSDDLVYPTDPNSDPKRPANGDPLGEDSMDRGAVIPDPERGADLTQPTTQPEIPDPDMGSDVPDVGNQPDPSSIPRD